MGAGATRCDARARRNRSTLDARRTGDAVDEQRRGCGRRRWDDARRDGTIRLGARRLGVRRTRRVRAVHPVAAASRAGRIAPAPDHPANPALVPTAPAVPAAAPANPGSHAARRDAHREHRLPDRGQMRAGGRHHARHRHREGCARGGTHLPFRRFRRRRHPPLRR